MEEQTALVHPLEAHAAETHAGDSARVIREDNLIGWQGHACAACEDDERPGWTVLNDGQLRNDPRFPVELGLGARTR